MPTFTPEESQSPVFFLFLDYHAYNSIFIFSIQLNVLVLWVKRMQYPGFVIFFELFDDGWGQPSC